MKLWKILETSPSGGALFISGKPNELKINDHAALKHANISHVVSLVAVGSAWLERVGFTYLPFVVMDGRGEHGINPAVTQSVAKLVFGLLQLDHRVLVHCHAGKNRSGVVATLVVADLLHISNKEALAYVRERRPGAVNNPRWERWLLEGR